MKPLRPPRLALAASLAGLGCLAWALPPGAIPPAAGPGPPAGEPVGELIRRLGGDDFEAREAATRGLLGRADAAAALRAAAKSPSPEVRRGVARILGEIDRRRVSGTLAEAVTLVNRGAEDEAVERPVRWGGLAG